MRQSSTVSWGMRSNYWSGLWSAVQTGYFYPEGPVSRGQYNKMTLKWECGGYKRLWQSFKLKQLLFPAIPILSLLMEAADLSTWSMLQTDHQSELLKALKRSPAWSQSRAGHWISTVHFDTQHAGQEKDEVTSEQYRMNSFFSECEEVLCTHWWLIRACLILEFWTSSYHRPLLLMCYVWSGRWIQTITSVRIQFHQK